MDVTCERCGTEYEFDETLVAARGTTVKCTNCGHLFKVFRPGAAASAAAAETRTWAIRRDGSSESESIASLKELQRRITLGHLTPDDEISRSGEGWKRLGDIAELQTFFAAAQAARSERREPTGRQATTGQGGREPTGGRVTDRRAYAPTVSHSTDRPPPPSSQPPGMRAGKSTMLGMGASGRSAPPTGDDIRGRTLEVAVPPPPTGPNGAPHATPSSAGSASAPRPMPPPARSPARAAPPSSRPPPPGTASTPPPIPPPPRPPSIPETQMDLGSASAQAIANASARERRAAAPTQGAPMPAPDARERPSVRPLHVDEDDDVPVRPRGRSWSGLWVALVVVLAIAGGVAAGWDRIQEMIAGGEETDPAEPFVTAGDGSLRDDHEDGYEDAIAHYTKALAFREHDARALTGLSRAHALIAQQRIFEASDLEASAADDPARRAEATTMRREATGHVEQAREHAEEAARHGGGDADVEIALSDALRLSGDPALAASRLARGRTLQTQPSAEALRVEALLAAGEAGNMAAAVPLAERAVAEDPGLLRARLLLARAQLAAGDVSSAQAQLQAILDRVADHPLALQLRAAIQEGRPPAAQVLGADAGAGTATTPSPAAAATPPTVAPPVATPPASTPPATTPPATTPPAAAPPSARGYDALVREADQRLENGDTRRARTLYEQALRERAGGAEATAGIGFVMLAEGNARGALTQLQSAADRGYADALIGVGDAHRRLDQREQALRAYERYLERQPSGPRASIARRQADRLRALLGPSTGGGAAGGGTTDGTTGAGGTSGTSGETGTTGTTEGTGATGGADEPAAPPTSSDELPGPRGATEAPPQDVPAIDSEP